MEFRGFLWLFCEKWQKNVVFWWDELLQVCGWHGTTFRVGKRSPVQGETERSVKNMEERLRSEKWKRYEEFLVEGEKPLQRSENISMIYRLSICGWKKKNSRKKL